MSDFIDFTGKKIIITGASSGIGKRTAILLSRLGASLILIARREEALKETINQLKGNNHIYYPCDLSKTNEIGDLVEKIILEKGKVDGLVYSSGINNTIPLNQSKPEFIQRVFDINFFGFVEIVRQICRRGRFNAGMHIVGISSVASLRGEKAHLAYGSSKAAMNEAIKCIAKEVANKGIYINAVAPAMTNTEMYAEYIQSVGEENEVNKELLKRQYLGVIEADQVANAVAFLLSDASKYITGITFPVDGGLTSN